MAEQELVPVTKNNNNRLNIGLDMRIVSIFLLVIIACMLLAWKPWANVTSNDRTVTVSGESTIKATPDEYVFYPTYEFKDANKDTALSALTKKSDEVVKKLKELGVQDSKIKTNSDGNNYPDYYLDKTSNENTYNLRLTVTVDNKDLAQKVQDYIVTTTPLGQVSPQPTFSESKRKELESKARDAATKDARAKAEQSAKNLGFKVGGVKSVDDGTQFGGIMPMAADGMMSGAETKTPSLGIQPGENDLSYTVTVTYFVR